MSSTICVEEPENYHMNIDLKGHVCGAIELESKSPAEFASIEDFLSNSIEGHRAGVFVQWEKYTEEKQ